MMYFSTPHSTANVTPTAASVIIARLVLAAMLFMWVVLSHTAQAQEARIATPEALPTQMPTDTARWGFTYENDLFVPIGRDQDYTYGLSFSYAKPSLLKRNSHTPLAWFNRQVGLDGANKKGDCGGVEFGLYGFTPENITQSAPNHDDRPFASLVYMSTNMQKMSADGRGLLRTQLTYGILGLQAVGQVQRTTHDILNGDTPGGWDHQISSGSEPTLRYLVSRQRLLKVGTPNTEFRQTQTASVGYITEASWGLSFRTGKINSQWQTFSPEIASYAESSASINRSHSEWFFWGGATVKARAYNVFLQGQFRDSVVTYGGSELHHVIVEGWLGFTKAFASGYYVSYSVRGHSSEVKDGNGDRAVVWGGLLVGKRV
ncbi:lipid A deacylase LpxR family protein [Marinagarivorans algicola]|uniref:lipid A deacylase LpxR family protein n=1 Tax=Marinagarivorans algicola TaxID=1513270 RepID=UPI0009EAD61B|nr:lipid A deacylase LpxR family protein [Marinagarivorans algicola]